MNALGKDEFKTIAQEDSLDTRTKLILTAERLLSEGGISGTPLRRITQEANQRNESAIHYHFGSRQGVVEAILDLRTPRLNTTRLELLEALKTNAEGRPLSSRQVAVVMVDPLADYLRETRGEGYYLRFLGMLWLDQAIWRELIGQTRDEGLIVALDALIRANPHIPVPVLRQKFGLAIQMSTYSLARMEKIAGEQGGKFDWTRAEVQITGIIDAIAAIFDAPLSPETVSALGESGILPKR